MNLRGVCGTVSVQGEPALFRLEDRYSKDYSTPVLDEKQDKTLLWARQADGVTSFAFTMPVRNCGDPEQDVGIPHDRFTHVLYAHGEDESRVRGFRKAVLEQHLIV